MQFFRSVGLIAVGAIAASGAWQALDAAGAANTETYRQLNLFGDVYDRVLSDYVEVPNQEKLIDAAINGMLTSLDPHSSYMNAKRFQDMQVQTRGEFGGLGIEVTMENGVIKVVAPIDDTPAAKAGILANDLIVRIDDEDVRGLTLNQAVDKMRGRVDTKIKLTILRPGQTSPFDVTLTRSIIRINPVKSRVEGGDVGYIRISSFNEQTQPSLEKAIDKLKSEVGDKLKGYIIDLRNNPGGLLDQAISVSDTFLNSGEIVSTRGRNASETQRFSAQSGDMANGKKIVVLINGGSASASEIVSGALQDQKRATIIGTRSFGKGSVQTIIPLGGQGALRLTTARYYTPSGRSIQAEGITPDIRITEDIPPALKGQSMLDRGEASLRGHLKNNSITKEETGSSSYVPKDKAKDKQLRAAIAFLNGEKVEPSPLRATTEDAAQTTTGEKKATAPTTQN